MDVANVVAELLGVASGLLLVMPAIALNKHLREVKDAQGRIASRSGELTRAIAARTAPTFEDARIPSWSERDQKLLVGGILAFVLSSVIKLTVAFNAPATPAPVVALPAAPAAPAGAAK